jgi:hypothetical protein
MIIGEQINLSEASEREIEAVLRKCEMRMMIAIERARRDAIRTGRDELKAIQQDEQLLTIFSEVVEAGSRAGLGWLALASVFTRIKGSGFEGEAGEINSRIQQHCALAREKANDWLVSIVARACPCVRRREAS